MSNSPDVIELSVVIPAYHSQDTIAKTVEEIISCVTVWCPDYEIVIVNDGSRDDTFAVRLVPAHSLIEDLTSRRR